VFADLNSFDIHLALPPKTSAPTFQGICECAIGKRRISPRALRATLNMAHSGFSGEAYGSNSKYKHKPVTSIILEEYLYSFRLGKLFLLNKRIS
jgi:hypothetical protein